MDINLPNKKDTYDSASAGINAEASQEQGLNALSKESLTIKKFRHEHNISHPRH